MGENYLTCGNLARPSSTRAEKPTSGSPKRVFRERNSTVLRLYCDELALQIALVDAVQRLHRGDVNQLITGVDIAYQRSVHDDRYAVLGNETSIATAVLANELYRFSGNFFRRDKKQRIGRDPDRLRNGDHL